MEDDDFGTPEKSLQFLRENADDISGAEIPVQSVMNIRDERGRIETFAGNGMVIRMSDGHAKFIPIEVAEKLLNDGLLQRLRIAIKLVDTNGQGHGWRTV